MISFASYGFNKSHTAAYGLIAYQTAYLKVKYPKAFMAAILTSVIGEEGKTVGYIEECERLKIKVLPPHVNRSNARFSVIGDDIAFSLLSIKNLGRALIDKIERERTYRENRRKEVVYTGRILHLDGDKKYSEKSIKFYTSCGFKIEYERKEDCRWFPAARHRGHFEME